MPKMKSRRGAAKRFKLTKSGKIRKSNANKNHLMNKKDSNRKRGLRKSSILDNAEVKRVKKMLGV
tara:strand:+ start:230 stop:424 length:195 start_codon:yes stop_codon:yes gene_type:complete